jgi:hypothetical protein
LYQSSNYELLQGHLQRFVHHFPHVIDYVCLLTVKRVAIGGDIDRAGWTEVVNASLRQHLSLGHHHEACWLFWFSVVCGLPLDQKVLDDVPKLANYHLTAMLIQAFVDGKVAKRPAQKFGSKLASDGQLWLINLVSRCCGFTGASFSGPYVDEFEHLSKKKLKLINFAAHIKRVSKTNVRAISNVRFGYEDEDGDGDNEDFDDALDVAFDHQMGKD